MPKVLRCAVTGNGKYNQVYYRQTEFSARAARMRATKRHLKSNMVGSSITWKKEGDKEGGKEG
jgi:hypothetical protein